MNPVQALMPDVWRVLRGRTALRARVRTRDERQDERRFVRFTSKGSDTAEVLIYDEIGMCGVEADTFARELQDITAATIHCRINSPGGDVFDSIAIYNALVDHPARVEVTVDSLAASGASVIAMAGEKITMNRGSQLMIHDAYTATIGNAADLRETATLLDRFSDAIAAVYAGRAGGAAKEWRDLMRTETWYTGPEAVDARLAHHAIDAPPATDQPVAAWNLANSAFFFAGRAQAPAPRPINRAMPVHHTATENSAWDGPAAVKAMPAKASVLQYCHAWQDSTSVDSDSDDNDRDADDQKSSYKFPHHRTKGGPANLAACRNGLARLDGADIPDADRAGVERHLQAHLDDAGDGTSNHVHHDDASAPFIDPKLLRKAVKEALR